MQLKITGFISLCVSGEGGSLYTVKFFMPTNTYAAIRKLNFLPPGKHCLLILLPVFPCSSMAHRLPSHENITLNSFNPYDIPQPCLRDGEREISTNSDTDNKKENFGKLELSIYFLGIPEPFWYALQRWFVAPFKEKCYQDTSKTRHF